MQTKEYNGYTNYETWCWCLWIDNDQAMYEDWRQAAREAWEDSETDGNVLKGILTRREAAKFSLANRMKEEAEEAMPDVEGVWSDMLRAALSEVDWHQVAETRFDDDSEYAQSA